jgi:hypothetical protein
MAQTGEAEQNVVVGMKIPIGAGGLFFVPL